MVQQLQTSSEFKQDKGWIIWKDIGKRVIDIKRWVHDQDYDLVERELDEVRSVYFDAIELQDQFLRLD